MERLFTKAQWRIFIGIFLSYSAAYVARLNMAAALPSLMNTMELTATQGGMFQTGFALIYAAGQLINGALVDKISARKYIFIGMISSALCNLLAGCAQSFGVILFAWCLNGVAQSMLWTPIVKLMAVWFHGKSRDRVGYGATLTLVAGNMAAWAISGVLAEYFSWRMSFLIPAAVIGSMGILSAFLLKDKPDSEEDEGCVDGKRVETAADGRKAVRVMPLKKLFFGTGLALILVSCITNGFVRDGIITWTPTIVASLNTGMDNSLLIAVVIPLLNLCGILLSSRLYAMVGRNSRRCIALLMCINAGLSLLLLAGSASMIACVLLLGLTCASTYAINPLLTSMVPMEYEPTGRVGLVAGVIDCFIYLGSSLAGIATGALSDALGWNFVFVGWSLAALAGAGLVLLSMRYRERVSEWGN